MSDAGSPDLPEYTPKPHGDGLWGRYLGAATWVKVGIPLVVIALVIGVGVLIGQSGNGKSTSSGDQNTEELLALLAAKMATQDETTTTAAETTTTEAETTTTEEETTTTEAETTTTEAATTTTVAETTTTPTTVPVTPTTQAPPPPTTPPTIPETTTTEAETTTTEAETTTTEAETSTTEAETTTTEAIPPGSLFASLEDFQNAWNATAQGSSVGPITAWSAVDVNGTAADVADIGGNLRVGAVVNGANGAVTRVALGWLPLTDKSEQAQQNALFQDAFSVLVRTVNPAATSEQQSGLASDLGITGTEPPFPTGTTTRATLAPERYALEAVDVPEQAGPVTIVGARRL
jgi:hypothetical protein